MAALVLLDNYSCVVLPPAILGGRNTSRHLHF